MATSIDTATLRAAADVDEATVAEFGASLRGKLIRPLDATYDEART